MEKILTDIPISTEKITIENNIKTEKINIDFKNISNTNTDIVGWIKVPNTQINYPVVQTNDNSFYLNHSLDKTYNKAGWIFADYRITNFEKSSLDKNTIIYGHNRENNSMFGTLKNTLKSDWQKNTDNKYINFSSLTDNMIWEIFSIYTINDENFYLQTDFSSDIEFEQFLNKIKNKSLYNYNIDLSLKDKILTLSTCTNIGNGRTVVHAKLLNY